jgi:hypothetical protein
MNLDEVEARMNRTSRGKKGKWTALKEGPKPIHEYSAARARIFPGDGDHRHGTANGYSNLMCRCDLCTEANRVTHKEYVDRVGYRPINKKTGKRSLTMEEYEKVRPRAQHGTESMYTKGCRCEKCRFAGMAGRASRARQ